MPEGVTVVASRGLLAKKLRTRGCFGGSGRGGGPPWSYQGYPGDPDSTGYPGYLRYPRYPGYAGHPGYEYDPSLLKMIRKRRRQPDQSFGKRPRYRNDLFLSWEGVDDKMGLIYHKACFIFNVVCIS